MSLSYTNFQKLCRGCLSEDSHISLRTENNEHDKFRKLLKMLIYSSFDAVKGKQDDSDENRYPQKICQFCYEKLQNIYEFQKIVMESEKKIRYALNTTSNNNKNIADENDEDEEMLATKVAVECVVKNEPEENDERNSLDEQKIEKNNYDNQLKLENDSEYEEDNSRCQFSERNALGNLQPTNGVGDEKLDTSLKLRTAKKHGSTKSRKCKKDPFSSKKSLKCPQCNKQVYKQVYLDAHIRAIHEGHEKPFLCNGCKKSFTRYNQLHVHMRTCNHPADVKLTADPNISDCDATFEDDKILETHRKDSDRLLSEDQNKAPLDLAEIIAQHQQQLETELALDNVLDCRLCGKKYSSKRALSEHLKRHLQFKEHVCKVCGVAKVTRTELVTHMRTHEPNLEKFKCTICPQEFNHKNAIYRHIRVVHQGERRFKCSYCSRRLGTRHAQITHERLHTGERPFKCEICSKGFPQLEGLKSHMKNHDKSLRTHVCKFCSQRFITRKNLTDHEQRHTGNKPHICEVCSRGYGSRKDLESHKKVHVDEISNKKNAIEIKKDDSNNSN